MKKEFEHITLTNEERADMRARLRLFMAEHPVTPTWTEKLFAKRASAVPGVTFMQPALAALLIVFLVGGGTTYAAAEALPGDILYTVKTKINEPLAGAFAVSSEAKANWNATLAAKRLEEAGTLALEGRLTPEAREIIEENFEKHAKAFEENTVALADENEHIEIAADVQSHMEVALKSRADVLTEMSMAIPDIETELGPILETIHSRVIAVESARVATEGVLAARIGKEIEEAAEAKRRLVEHEVEAEDEDRKRDREDERADKVATRAVRAKSAPEQTPEPEAATMMMSAAVIEDTVSTSTETEIEIQTEEEGTVEEEERDEARRAYREGSLKFEEGKHGEAYTAFQKAWRAVEKKKLDADVRKRLKVEDKINQNWKNKNTDDEKTGDDD